ncbi:hypothetical protein [Alloprevotella sp. OH1205_COT-284]|uniref:hypothetical protein n=1 Tax=Alloprevotella sp. OH1205_COT-284 TaxID=2491043 RepID=UPI00131593B0|nr:hypothetical protein [Alloprevotella sp. OH1205_COT-284]
MSYPRFEKGGFIGGGSRGSEGRAAERSTRNDGMGERSLLRVFRDLLRQICRER